MLVKTVRHAPLIVIRHAGQHRVRNIEPALPRVTLLRSSSASGSDFTDGIGKIAGMNRHGF